MKTTSQTIKIKLDHLRVLLQHVKSEAPYEACGILTGKEEISKNIFPIKNTSKSERLYFMSPKDLFETLIFIDENNLDLLAIYHSHPNGQPTPSETDISQAYYPEAVHIILSSQNDNWRWHAYKINGQQFSKVKLKIT